VRDRKELIRRDHRNGQVSLSLRFQAGGGDDTQQRFLLGCLLQRGENGFHPALTDGWIVEGYEGREGVGRKLWCGADAEDDCCCALEGGGDGGGGVDGARDDGEAGGGDGGGGEEGGEFLGSADEGAAGVAGEEGVREGGEGAAAGGAEEGEGLRLGGHCGGSDDRSEAVLPMPPRCFGN